MNKKSKLLIAMAMMLSMMVGVFAGFTPKTASAATMGGVLVPTMVTDLVTAPTAATTTMTLPGTGGNKAATQDSTAAIVPIQVDQKGVLQVAVAASGLTDHVYVKMYTDSGCTMEIGNYSYLTTSSLTSTKTYTISNPGTYYLKAYYWYASDLPTAGSTIGVAAVMYSGAETTLSSTYSATYTGDSTITNYHKIVLASDSLITLQGNSFSSDDGTSRALSLSFCDSSKVALDSSVYLYSSNNHYIQYALKKGTYYVSTNESNPYQIKYTAAKVSEKSGTKKGKAVTIKKKKSVKGMVALSESTNKGDYYKIKLTKKAKITLKMSAVCTGTGSLKVEIIPADSHYTLLGNTTYLSTGSKGIRSKNKLKKGVYYVKVSKSYGDFSGTYKIKYTK